jgi:hypothetical protein
MSNAHAEQPTPVEWCGQQPFGTLCRTLQMAAAMDQ